MPLLARSCFRGSSPNRIVLVCHIHGVPRLPTGRVKLGIVLFCTVHKTRHPILIQRIEIRWRMAVHKLPSDVQWLAIIDTSGGSTKSHWFAGEAGMHNHQSPSEDGTSMPRWIRPGSTIIKGQAFQAILPWILLANHRDLNLEPQQDPRAPPDIAVRSLHNPQSKTSTREQPGQDSQMAPRTIAERAAAGEIQSADGLTLEEKRELVVWARSQGISYREIVRRYGFTESEGALRGWRNQVVNNRPPRVATFTPEDDELIRRGVELFATGPLDDPESFVGIWPAVRDYIRKNGAATTAGVSKLKERWGEIANQGGTAQPGPPQARLARSFPVPTGEGQPSSSAPPRTRRTRANTEKSSTKKGANADLTWGKYKPLSAKEMMEVLGIDDDAYDALSKKELREVLGSDYPDDVDEDEEDGSEDDEYDDEEGEKPRGSRSRKG